MKQKKLYKTKNPKRKALVIEDDPLFRRSAIRFLHSKGFDVTEARNAFEGLELWNRAFKSDAPFDLVCTDYDTSVSANSGGLTGMDVVEQTVRANPSQMTVVITGATTLLDRDLEDRLLEASADAVMRKPLNFDDLGQLIENIQSKDGKKEKE